MQDHPRPTARARTLRSAATPAEKRLWLALSNRQLAGAKFSRQMPIGPYIADFLCRAHRLVVEVDDGSHDLRWREDVVRTAYLEREGYQVVRLTNADIRDRLDGVLHVIGEALAARPHPAATRPPLPLCGRGSREAAGWGHATSPPATLA